MEIGMLDVDGHNFPNLAQMKISAYHKKIGDNVERWIGLKHYDRVYVSKVFDDTYTKDIEFCIDADEVIYGGTGYDLKNVLPYEIEHQFPDYSLYGIRARAYGFLTRGCPRGCPFCIVAEKEGRKSYKVADLREWWNGYKKEIMLLDPNILACPDHMELLEQLAESKALVDFTQGLDARFLNDKNIEVLNRIRVKMLHFAWDLMSESDDVIRGLQLYKKIGSVKERNRRVYVLTNYNTTMDENLYRIEKLKELEYDPYVMVYNKPSAPKEVKRLQRWCNNKFIYRSCPDFKDYKA